MANALKKLEIKEGDVLGTIALNGYRHYELYFAISGIGAVLHTLNPRLFPEQVEYIVNHAEDKYIFVDLPFLPIVENVYENIDVGGIILLCEKSQMPAETKIKNLICYEELIADESDEIDWPEFNENTASSLCYTSGTTGNPKGVLYSHKSTLLHAWAGSSANGLGLDKDDSIPVSYTHLTLPTKA